MITIVLGSCNYFAASCNKLIVILKNFLFDFIEYLMDIDI
jgi:hypothetical protein